jgi:hypothetical protein
MVLYYTTGEIALSGGSSSPQGVHLHPRHRTTGAGVHHALRAGTICLGSVCKFSCGPVALREEQTAAANTCMICKANHTQVQVFREHLHLNGKRSASSAGVHPDFLTPARQFAFFAAKRRILHTHASRVSHLNLRIKVFEFCTCVRGLELP